MTASSELMHTRSPYEDVSMGRAEMGKIPLSPHRHARLWRGHEGTVSEGADWFDNSLTNFYATVAALIDKKANVGIMLGTHKHTHMYIHKNRNRHTSTQTKRCPMSGHITRH